jgi:hypothetical protein
VVYHIKNLPSTTFLMVGGSTDVSFDTKRGRTHLANLLLKTLTIDGCFYRCVYATVLYRLFFLVFSISLPSCNCITKQCVTPAGSGSVFCYCQPVNWIQNWNRIKWSALWCERVVLWGLNAARGCEALCALHGWSFFWCSSFRFAPTTVLTFPSPLSAAHLLIN